MFNMWNRTYVQTFNQRQIFDSKTILAANQWAKVVFNPDAFTGGGEVVAQGWNLDDVVDEHYDGKYSNFLAAILGDSQNKWAIVVDPVDYYKLLAYYLKELQHTFKLTAVDLNTVAFSYLYNNFYYADDQSFVDQFVTKQFQKQMIAVFSDYTPVGVLDNVDPSVLPTELAYFLVERVLVDSTATQSKMVNIAQSVVARLWQVYKSDFSEWLVLDTKQFLNLMKSPDTPEIVTTDISFSDMFNLVSSDDYMSAMFFSSSPFSSGGANWESDPNFKITANRLVNAWEGLANYLVQRGIDDTWSELRHNQYAELILRYDSIKSTCAAVKYILQLDNAPTVLDKPIMEMLGYETVSECLDSRYNSTLLLIAFKGMSDTFAGFVNEAFEVEQSDE